MPAIDSDVALLPWFLPAGEARTITIDFTDDNDDPVDPGVVTVDGGASFGVHATIGGSGTTRTVHWSSGQTVAVSDSGILGGKWRLRIDGVTKIGGPIRGSSPSAIPSAGEWTVALPSETDTITVTIRDGGDSGGTVVGGGLDIRATYTIPMVARWNPTSLVPGIYPGRVFLFGCPVADITPAPPAPFQVLVDSAFADGTPSDPTVDDIPGDDAWSVVQDLEDADIYGALLVPVDYLVPPYEAYLPPQFEGSYPFDTPIWYRGSSIDADGFATVFHMFMPDGIPADPEAFPMIVFADGNRFEFTVAAPGSDTAEGAANDVTVDYEATGGTDAVPSARNVDARMAALEARLAALE